MNPLWFEDHVLRPALRALRGSGRLVGRFLRFAPGGQRRNGLTAGIVLSLVLGVQAMYLDLSAGPCELSSIGLGVLNLTFGVIIALVVEFAPSWGGVVGVAGITLLVGVAALVLAGGVVVALADTAWAQEC